MQPKNPGTKPKITLDQYRKIVELKRAKQSPVKQITYAFLAKDLGLLPSAVINAARRGIKRYDYQLWQEEKANAEHSRQRQSA